MDRELFKIAGKKDTPVTCLGMEFPSDAARREYFTEELRKKYDEKYKIFKNLYPALKSSFAMMVQERK